MVILIHFYFYIEYIFQKVKHDVKIKFPCKNVENIMLKIIKIESDLQPFKIYDTEFSKNA